MPKNDPALSFPIRGVPGGWRDRWDEPHDPAQLRARGEAAEAHLLTQVAITRRRWQHEITREQAQKRRSG